MAQKGSKRPSPNHHKAICSKSRASGRKAIRSLRNSHRIESEEGRGDWRGGAASSNAAKRKHKDESRKEPY
jgi:hypothetical protein